MPYVRLCISLMHITPSVSAEGFDPITQVMPNVKIAFNSNAFNYKLASLEKKPGEVSIIILNSLLALNFKIFQNIQTRWVLYNCIETTCALQDRQVTLPRFQVS